MLAHQHDAQITILHVIEKLSAHASYAVRSFVGEDTWKKLSSGRQTQANSDIEERPQSLQVVATPIREHRVGTREWLRTQLIQDHLFAESAICPGGEFF